jgi:poly-gamma-glutamate synthesis protein (capsule biosynthesis protein)
LTIPLPHAPRLARLYETVRYEEGRWPLWRWDRNLRYIAKSLAHRPTPWTMADHEHHVRARDYLESGAWKTAAKGACRWVAGGDLMWVRSGFRDALSPRLRRVVAEADLALVNLETPIVPEHPVPRLVYETLHYNSPPDYLDAFRSDLPRVVSLCNNHALDQGEHGLRRTREVVREQGFTVLGGPDGGDESSAVQVGDLSIGLLALTYDVNHLVGVPPDGILVERFGDAGHEPDWTRLAARIDEARRAGPDLVVLLAHWGFEYEYWPSSRQRAHALRLIELGVDVIVGSSPHVLQPIEVVSVDGADEACPLQAHRGGPPRFGLIAWSLGNLCTIMPTLPCQVGALLSIDVGRDDRGIPAFGGIHALPTLSARGLGRSWLDGATVALDDLPGDAREARAHARTMLGSLIQGAS